MTVVLDSREKTRDRDGVPLLIAERADERRLLRYDGPGGEVYSYDLLITTKAGQSLRVEAKWSWKDAYATWRDRQDDGHSRLTRQAGAVDLVFVVWDDFQVELQCDKSQVSTVKGLKNRLMRMNVEGPSVCIFGSVADCISFIDYLERRKEPLLLRPSAPEPS